jgi:L,D-transpeptidase catalytic domain/SPOR domain
MARRRRTFLTNPKLLWTVVLVVGALDGAGLSLLARDIAAEEATRVQRLAAPEPPAAPIKLPPPAMIHPPTVEAVLRSGTLMVISKKSQTMFVFSDGQLWASTPISSGKRRHETPSGVFPILQKHKLHRSNIYSNAPMPFMQRLTWDGIALHAGWVPGYAASHGCVRLPRAFAEALFKLTDAQATTVIIGDEPLETEVQAQHYALTTATQLPVRSALAPPPDSSAVAAAATAQLYGALAIALPQMPLTPQAAATKPAPTPPPALASPAQVPAVGTGETIQLAAAASQAEAEAHWAHLLRTYPDLSRFQKSVEAATVKSRPVYRLRISGADAQAVCVKLKSAGVSCFGVS